MGWCVLHSKKKINQTCPPEVLARCDIPVSPRKVTRIKILLPVWLRRRKPDRVDHCSCPTPATCPDSHASPTLSKVMESQKSTDAVAKRPIQPVQLAQDSLENCSSGRSCKRSHRLSSKPTEAEKPSLPPVLQKERRTVAFLCWASQLPKCLKVVCRWSLLAICQRTRACRTCKKVDNAPKEKEEESMGSKILAVITLRALRETRSHTSQGVSASTLQKLRRTGATSSLSRTGRAKRHVCEPISNGLRRWFLKCLKVLAYCRAFSNNLSKRLRINREAWVKIKAFMPSKCLHPYVPFALGLLFVVRVAEASAESHAAGKCPVHTVYCIVFDDATHLSFRFVVATVSAITTIAIVTVGFRYRLVLVHLGTRIRNRVYFVFFAPVIDDPDEDEGDNDQGNVGDDNELDPALTMQEQFPGWQNFAPHIQVSDATHAA